jgi:maltose alpha-D-glucosyltransferase/alpha-amylase
MLAEACQKPHDVVDYLKTGDECNAAYHFPLMPQMFKAIHMENADPVKKTLSTKVTPEIPPDSQWFTFLRCHDELSLELVYVSEEDRAYIHNNYCHQPEWDFRVGEGISARLSDLFKQDVRKIKLAYSIMLSLPGTPIIYYGDEFGKGNDEAYYKEQIQLSGKDDTRFLVRGKIDWLDVSEKINNPDSLETKVYEGLSTMTNSRNKYKAFGRGTIEWIESNEDALLAYFRVYENEKLLFLQNLSGEEITYKTTEQLPDTDILGNKINLTDNLISIPAYSYFWINVSA